MEFGVVVRQVGTGWEGTRRAAEAVEEAGFDSVWLIDHLLGFPPQAGILEAWTALSGLAVATSRVGLGAQVFCQSFRQPALLAKMATTLDLISGGRLHFLVGAGWWEEEYRAFGYQFPPPGVRVGEVEDAVRVLRGLWDAGDRPFTYEGRHARVVDALNLPAPERRIPIGVGGAGPRMLDLAARLADEWNCPAAALPAYPQLRQTLETALADAGRSIRRSCQIVFAPGDADVSGLAAFNPDLGLRGSTQQMVDRVGELSAMGIDGLYGMPAGRRAIDAVAEALPELRAAAG
ncbi:MAG TPA: LLM class flavin-dependent oxidoreductase [Acidimicrobiales bacterium]|nr:LLM class flavin-dependent oxidoreductase [Acidimicrobiales bacterium]